MRTSALLVRDVSLVSPVALLLFGGNLHHDAKAGLVAIDDGWFRFRVGADVAAVLLLVRRELDALLERKMGAPDAEIGGSRALIDGITRLIDACGAVVPGTSTFAYFDNGHLTAAGSMYLWPYLCPYLGPE